MDFKFFNFVIDADIINDYSARKVLTKFGQIEVFYTSIYRNYSETFFFSREKYNMLYHTFEYKKHGFFRVWVSYNESCMLCACACRKTKSAAVC